MGNDDLIAVLRKAKVFKDLTEHQIKTLAGKFSGKNYEAGDVILKETEPSEELLILASGELQVKSQNDVFGVINEMGVVGEMGVLTEHPRSANVIATIPSKVLSISKDDLLGMIADDKDFGFHLYKNVTDILSAHLRDNNFLLEFYYLAQQGRKE